MSLRNDDYYALTAYLLQINGIISSDQIVNAQTRLLSRSAPMARVPRAVLENKDQFSIFGFTPP